MQILVTGGAGYLGSVLVPALLDAGHRVHVLDDFRYGQGQALAALTSSPRFAVTRGDARNRSAVYPLLKTADAVIPLAAIVGAPACLADQDAAVLINQTAIHDLCGWLSQDQLVVYPNTNSGYGAGGDLPLDEASPMKPISLYGNTKFASEVAIMARENSISLRFATLFGASPRMRLDLLVNDFVYRAVNDRALTLFEGGFRRNFLHVRDAARAFVHAIDNFDAMRDRAYNVGHDDANLTKRALCERIRARVPDFVWHEAATGEDPDRRDYVVSNARIAASGFRPAFSLDDGIDELVKLYAMLRRSEYGNA